MRTPPPLRDALNLPVTSAIAILAIALTFARYGNYDISGLIDTAEARRGEPWRFLTTALPHANLLHLFFNLSWWWSYGSLVESTWGGARLLAMAALCALASMAGELAFFGVGIGLSGVVYGLWAFFAVLEGHDRRTLGAADKRTSNLFVFWFFFCIAMTVFDILPVANAAHGFGALIGAGIGACVRYKGQKRAAAIAGTGALACLLVFLAMVCRPWVNLGHDAYGEMRLGTKALENERGSEAIRWLEDAVRIDPKMASAWWNLSIAYGLENRSDEAASAYRRALELDPKLIERQPSAE